ncbi:hypothetical protein PVAND_011597 [Polypedilum vanderplanki]|uniref:Uncharacterized protein n=1 Tax=Polypedilum vanderplanki TaxID=319348 RepID=A0A9J6CJY5_POLVA|nr:hypothetical protein PVAND_011597 [Polypedilum vanderplanki]
MKRKHWGEFKEKQDDVELAKKLEMDRQIIFEKRSELKILHSSVYFEPKENRIQLSHKNPAVNQIVGLKQKQELIQELIDTSQNDVYTFQQILPGLNSTLEVFPTKIVTPKVNDKLNCFISTIQNDFTTGKPKNIQKKVNKKCVDLALRKSICGLLRITDFTDITESALQLMTDSVDHFYKSLMESIVNVLNFDDRDTETDIDIMTFEKAFFNLMNESSTVFLNYFKNEIYLKNQQVATEFTEKVAELKKVVNDNSHQNLLINEIQHSEFSTNSQFYIKEEVKQEYDDYEDEA